MANSRYIQQGTRYILKQDGSTGAVRIRIKKGDAPFVESVKKVNQDSGYPITRIEMNVNDLRRLREANRGPGSGKPRHVGIRMKQDTYGSVEQRAEELGMSVSEYVRTLIFKDIGVVT